MQTTQSLLSLLKGTFSPSIRVKFLGIEELITEQLLGLRDANEMLPAKSNHWNLKINLYRMESI